MNGLANALADLTAELDVWQAAGTVASVWLRDDDAVAPSPALDRLLAISDDFACPALIAVIPLPATAALADRLAGSANVTVCQHGYRHENHAPANVKKTELFDTGPARSVDHVLDELRQGRERLSQLFAQHLEPILVPPWNRMSNAVAARVHEAGFAALSGFGWKRFPSPLPQVNTHVDLIDWRGDRHGKTAEVVAAETAAALQTARQTGQHHIGLLTHHLVHDETAWASLVSLLEALARHPAGRFASAPQLLQK
ncbi:polysaccharide deacetylase family protein [Mesorhizobium xinjiangense]|uniref:polysaccharide deacetylase family protein n=1 Tax=Mesorhizobium xinjiangense TaxID=2678685 RepID=UPI0012ECDAD9|nr:polysaccharide deacetylase family protein [Mesorhizobium xinjiangense]